MKVWTVYIVMCSDGSLYTGISIDVDKRILKHNSGEGAKAIKGKLPVRLVHVERFEDHSSALKREFEIKKLSRNNKLKLI